MVQNAKWNINGSFFIKMLHRLRLPVEINTLKWILIISISSTVKNFIFYMLASYTCTLNKSEQFLKICKLAAYFEVTFWGIFLYTKEQKSEKNAQNILNSK